jgi:hypothetical protein
MTDDGVVQVCISLQHLVNFGFGKDNLTQSKTRWAMQVFVS